MAAPLSKAKFVALLALRADLGKPQKVPDPLAKARAIVISDWPARNAQLLLRLCRALSGRDEVFSLRDVEGLDLETVSVALALTMAGVNERYEAPAWRAAVLAMEQAVTRRKKRGTGLATPAQKPTATRKGR
jgi:hypothetical protein